jgi:hypothetical protein
MGAMLGAKLLLVIMLGQMPEEPSDPASLVQRLGSGRYADREAATQALERLGRTALPALRAARDSRDLEIRNRAGVLIQKIEGSLLTQPTRIRLDFEHAPLTDVVRSLSQQAGFKFALYPDNLPKWKYQKVTLREPEPVPFWKAVDQLCDVAGLQQQPAMHGIAGPREPTFALADGAMRMLTPNSDHGPFRVSLMGIHYQRDLNYASTGVGGFGGFGPPTGVRPAPPPAGVRPGPPRAGARIGISPVTSEQFTAHFQVAAEPRLSVSQNGALQLLEAVDNRGNSLINQAGAGPVVNRFAGYLGVMNASVIQLQAQLHRPEKPGTIIKKFRGVIPLSISSRRPDPLIVPLDQGMGKRFENADAELTVHGIRAAPNTHQTFIDITVRPNGRSSTPVTADESDAFGSVYRVDANRIQLEIVDSRDQLVSWFPSGIDSENSRLTLTLTSPPASSSLKEIRYYTLTRATVNVPFEFADIPMP